MEREVDVVIVGSGAGGLIAALVARRHGLEPLIIEKSEYIGGTSSWSGGALWAPASPLMREAGAQDSVEEAVRYLDAVVGDDDGPGTTHERRRAYAENAGPMVEFLQNEGVKFVYADGNPDYYPEAPGGSVRGRTHHAAIFDTAELGDWEKFFRPQKGGISHWMLLETLVDIPPMVLATRSLAASRGAARVLGRTVKRIATRRHLVGMGQAIGGRLVVAAKNRDVEIWRRTAVTDLEVTDGRVTGVKVDRSGVSETVTARHGVLLVAGGFAQNSAMRKQHRPAANSDWTLVIPEDTGDMIIAAQAHGAATALMDEAIWNPMSVPPDGVPITCLWERALPHSIIVDPTGRRFANEATSYMAFGQAMFAHEATPGWLIMDARHRRRYPLGAAPGGLTPRSWIRDGYLKKAKTLPELATQCGIDSDGLIATVERFNTMAAAGKDEDFGRGESHHDRVFSDPRYKPNPCLGPIEKAPFYAIALSPGDASTSGGLVADEHARVLREDGSVIEGLYAAGSTAASPMGRVYPASGCSVGSSSIFGYIAAQHICNR